MKDIVKKCQICDKKLDIPIFDFGFMPAVNQIEKRETESINCYSLKIYQCSNCNLVQLGTILDKEVLFPSSYPYRSKTTKLLHRNFENLVESVKIKNISSNFVVDIGSNDGTLLSYFKKRGSLVLGIEPTGASQDAILNGIETINDYFTPSILEKVKKINKNIDLITASNVFAHIDNPNQVMKLINELLDEKGVFISENHYLGSVVFENQYDTVYHEHLRYYSLITLIYFFNLHGFQIFDVEKIPTHGGSIRVFACKKGKMTISNRVTDLLNSEVKLNLHNNLWQKDFVKNIILSKIQFYKILESFIYNKPGAKLIGVGAPSRGSTLSSYLGLDSNILYCVLEHEDSPKIGGYLPGTGVPIISEENFSGDKSNPLLFFSWHIIDELLPILRRKGFSGPAIKPLPIPTLYDS